MHQPMQPEDQPQPRSQGTRKSSCLHLELPSSQEDGPVRWSGHDCQPLRRSWIFGQKHFAKQKLPGGLQQARLQCVQAWLQANRGQRQLDQEISKKPAACIIEALLKCCSLPCRRVRLLNDWRHTCCNPEQSLWAMQLIEPKLRWEILGGSPYQYKLHTEEICASPYGPKNYFVHLTLHQLAIWAGWNKKSGLTGKGF